MICLAIVFRDFGGFGKGLLELKTFIVDQPIDTLNVCLPSLLYVIQNNLLYVAASHLDAATYQVTYQLKILTTAIFSVIILRRKLVPTQWIALFILLAGIVLVQLDRTEMSGGNSNEETGIEKSNRLIGLLAAVLACCLSGFAGIYFEKILKGSGTSVWIRNVQLSLCSIPFASITCFLNDKDRLRSEGFFYGYDFFVFYLIVLQAAGGLLVAIVVKYADNVLKGFATSVAIILSCIVSVIFLDFYLSIQFAIGTTFVIASIFLYGYQPPKPPKSTLVAKV
jgi:UDP-sugar transporter A1/2/3